MEVAVVRTVPVDRPWTRIAPLVPGKAGDRGATGRDDRRFVEAVLWIARTGAPLGSREAAPVLRTG
jgi:putative transposase